jgi:aspartyl-tRNA(Asn)/glutamyl-tRNA(Gln) amidotransferase subunit B
MGGSVEIELPGAARNVMGEHKKIPLTRIHLEEDVGKLNHGAGGSLIDFNRAGTPLMEIVSEPALRSPEEAFAYLTSLKTTMIYGGISDCDMEKGQLRCDANVSLRPAGETKLGVKVELKNLNSISFVRDGIAHEIKRQLGVVERGGIIVQETRDYDGQTGASQSLRSKEMAHDYRYFPDPDLMPVRVDEAWRARLRAQCPELPFDKQRRFFEQYQLPYSITSDLIPDREWCDIFEEEAEKADPIDIPATANLIVNFFRSEAVKKAQAITDFRSRVPIGEIAKLAMSVRQRVILSTAVASVSSTMMSTGFTIETIVAKEGLGERADLNELERWCRDAIAGNPKALADFKSGKESAINGFKGPVMKAAKGKADPKLVDHTLRRLLAQM